MESKCVRGEEKVDERSRQGEKGQEESFNDRRGEECCEGERQTQKGNEKDQSG